MLLNERGARLKGMYLIRPDEATLVTLVELARVWKYADAIHLWGHTLENFDGIVEIESGAVAALVEALYAAKEQIHPLEQDFTDWEALVNQIDDALAPFEEAADG